MKIERLASQHLWVPSLNLSLRCGFPEGKEEEPEFARRCSGTGPALAFTTISW